MSNGSRVREVLEKWRGSTDNVGVVLSDLAEIVSKICEEESSKWVGITPDNKFATGVRAGIEAIEFRLSELFTDKEEEE